MLEDKTLAIAKTVSVFQQRFPSVKSKLLEDPTSFVTGILQDAEIQVPDGFHVHTVSKGEDLPEEPHLGTVDRHIYFFRLNGEVEHHIVNGSPSGNDKELKLADSCCKCLFACCVIETPDPPPPPLTP